MNQTGQKSLETLASPSNLAMATLVGFLFVGQSTDWKMLRGPRDESIFASAVRRRPRLSQGRSTVRIR